MTRRPALLPALAGLLALYLVAPLIAGLARAGGADWAGADWPALSRATAVSIVSATTATALIAIGGIPIGYLLARVPGRLMTVLGVVVQLPLALPPLTSGVLLLFLVGPVRNLTDSVAGIVLAQAFVASPFLIVAARSAFASIDTRLEDVALTLGHAPSSVFRRVSLALGWRNILAGLLLAWLRAFGEFGATVMVAYHPYSLPVFTYVAFGSEGLPAMLPILLPTLAAAVAILTAASWVLRPRAPTPIPEQRILPLLDAAPPLEPIETPGFELEARRQLPGFELTIAWRARSRRLAILGPSGSGKSLTLRLIAGLDGAPAHVRFGDRTLDALPPEARGLAYVPQNYGLLPNLTVAEQIRFAVDADPARAARWTERLDLSALAQHRPHQLSLGQQQRVALARALARPAAALLLLDEPFSALDTPLRVRLRQELLGLQREMPLTTVLVTHDAAEALLLADELLVIEGGRVLQAGPADAVFSRPADETVARLLGAEQVAFGRVTADGGIDVGGEIVIDVGGPALRPGTEVGWSVRPHQVRLSCNEGAYSATVLSRAPIRDGQRAVTVGLGGTVLSAVADPACPTMGPCRLNLDPNAIQVWPWAGNVAGSRGQTMSSVGGGDVARVG